jgi:hypothetical protein
MKHKNNGCGVSSLKLLKITLIAKKIAVKEEGQNNLEPFLSVHIFILSLGR